MYGEVDVNEYRVSYFISHILRNLSVPFKPFSSTSTTAIW